MGSSPSSLALMRVLDTELARPAQPVVALDARFCSTRPTTLHFERKAYAGSFRVRDITANRALRFSTTSASSPLWRTSSRAQQTQLLDANKRCIASFGPSAAGALKPAYAVHRGDNKRHHHHHHAARRLTRVRVQPPPPPPLFQIHARTKLATTDVHVDFTNATTGERCSVGLIGSWLHRTGILWLRQGPTGACEPVAKLYTPPHSHPRRDEFCLSVGANVDTALLALVCLVLHDRERRAAATTSPEQQS